VSVLSGSQLLIPLIPETTIWEKYYYPHFTDEIIDTKRCKNLVQGIEYQNGRSRM
jgi:hypothetical protein